MANPITATPTGIRINVHVQPRAATTEVVGTHGDRLKIRLAAPPVDGAANDALMAFVADQLGVPSRAVRIASGHSSRQKVVEVDGLTVADVPRSWG